MVRTVMARDLRVGDILDGGSFPDRFGGSVVVGVTWALVPVTGAVVELVIEQPNGGVSRPAVDPTTEYGVTGSWFADRYGDE